MRRSISMITTLLLSVAILPTAVQSQTTVPTVASNTSVAN